MLLTNFLICGFVLFSLPSITGTQRQWQKYSNRSPPSHPQRFAGFHSSLSYPSYRLSPPKTTDSRWRSRSRVFDQSDLHHSASSRPGNFKRQHKHSLPQHSPRRSHLETDRQPLGSRQRYRNPVKMQHKPPPKSRTDQHDFDAMSDIDFKTWKPTPPTTTLKRKIGKNVKTPAPTTVKSKTKPPVKPTTMTPPPTKSTTRKAVVGPTPPSHFLTAKEIASMVKEQGREGETLRLTCPNVLQTSFPQPPDVIWTSPESMELKAGHTGSRHVIQPDGALIIHKLTSVDRGAYKCSFVLNGKAMKNGTVLVSIEDCSTSPCMNGGVCEDLEGKTKSKLFCRCPDAYEGRYCETKKNLWILLVPFIGSAVVLLAIIAVIVRFTCFKKKKVTTLNPPEETQKLLSTEKRPPSLVKPLPPLRTTPSGHLPFYDVQTQSGDPAYWPDKRFSYEKFQDGVVTQTGNVDDYGGHRRGSQWIGPYAAHSAQTLPFYDQYGNVVTDLNTPYPDVPLREVIRQPSTEQYLTNVPAMNYGSREWYPQTQVGPQRSTSNFARPH